MPDAAEITRRAKSNLAFALRILPKERREAAVIFYAFCRVVDDLADDNSTPLEERAHGLERWRAGLEQGFEAPTPLERQVEEMRERHGIPARLLTAIVEGCEMDLRPRRYETWEDLSAYTWRVACAVGLSAMRIFGAQEKATERYAEALGHALQITNILRDVGEDWRNDGRIYLPRKDMGAVGYTEQDLAAGVVDARFLELMSRQARRAREFYETAADSLPESDRNAMTAGEIMRTIYSLLLDKMERDGFRVFDRRYRISRARKMAIFSTYALRQSFQAPPFPS